MVNKLARDIAQVMATHGADSTRFRSLQAQGERIVFGKSTVTIARFTQSIEELLDPKQTVRVLRHPRLRELIAS